MHRQVIAIVGTLSIAVLVLTAYAQRVQTPNLTTLYTFTGGSDGASPQSSVTPGSEVLYGTTYSGGASSGRGYGTIYSLTPPLFAGGTWTETVLHSFGAPGDGESPEAGVVIGPGGVLYGTTDFGGASKSGTVYSLTPPSATGGNWTEAILHSFTGRNDGAHPSGGVAIDANGVLYGTTYDGGPSGFGLVYSLKPPAKAGGAWTESVLHAFTGGSDGGGPESGVAIGKAGGGQMVLYGGTDKGGTANLGVAFSLTPSASGGGWDEAVLHNFTGGTDGSTASAGVILGPQILYGTTIAGGSSGHGTVYSLTPPAAPGGAWTEAVLLTFMGGNGANPSPGVVIGPPNGGHPTLYGSTDFGGASKHGAVYSLTQGSGTAWTETILHSFTGGSDGAIPAGGVVIGRDSSGRTALYGTTVRGGNGWGTVFSLTL